MCVCQIDRLGGVSCKGIPRNVCVCAIEIGYGVLVVRGDIGMCVCVSER